MINTKIKKAIAFLTIIASTTVNFTDVFAILDIGDGNIWATKATDIMWDEQFPGTASGSISWIKVKGRVLPTINMVVSTWTIDLGTLVAWTPSSGTLGIEVGTNAAKGVSITARSGSGWLTNISDNSIQINSLSTDWVAESYTFASTSWTDDSSYAAFQSTGDLTATEVNNTTTEHVIYTTNKPEQTNNTNADLTFEVETTTSSETAAWDYEDNITFTITGNF